mmetsp:Transcript_35128/g.45109  ORF Transcript_35128/g.45109 Transcript_35128/m.45109 type:complete len:1226 (+) Transcript_35128:224-3901(+)
MARKTSNKKKIWVPSLTVVIVLLGFVTMSSFLFFFLIKDSEHSNHFLYHEWTAMTRGNTVAQDTNWYPYQSPNADVSGLYKVLGEIGVAVRSRVDLDSLKLGHIPQGHTVQVDNRHGGKLVRGRDGLRRSRLHVTWPIDGWVTFGIEDGTVFLKHVHKPKEGSNKGANQGDGDGGNGSGDSSEREKAKQRRQRDGPSVDEVCQMSEFAPDKDMKGGDLVGRPFPGKNAEECCQQCFFNTLCNGFTFVGPGNCWLKKDKVGFSAGEGLVSGVLPEKRNMKDDTSHININNKKPPIEYEDIPPEKPVYCCSDHSDDYQLLIGKTRPKNTLWFDSAAKNWETVFPVGNGHMGALLGWDAIKDVIPLSEETLVTTHANATLQTPDKYNLMMKMRNLLIKKKYREAEEASSDISARDIGMYEYAGDIIMRFLDLEKAVISNYIRELDLSTGISTVQFNAKLNGLGNTMEVTKEAFASAVDDVLVLYLSCVRTTENGQKDGCLNVEFSLRREGEPKKRQSTITAGPVQWKLSGIMTHVLRLQKTDTKEHEVVPFEVCLAVAGGELSPDFKAVSVADKEELVVLVTVHSSYHHDEPHKQCMKTLEAAASLGYDKLKKDHIQDHKALFDRVDFSLSKTPGVELPGCDSWYPTNERIRRFGKDCIPPEQGGLVTKPGKVDDLSLYPLFYQFGRYLLIGSSRTGTKPANLQGVWANSVESPWGADYHLNINLQMNYWAAQTGNLAEAMVPYTTFIKDLSESGGKQTAQAYYRCPGWVAHGFTDLWMEGGMLGNFQWSMCPVCGAWAAVGFWETFEHQRNISFLRTEALPVLEGAVEFFMCYLFEVPEYQGLLLSGPSTSPENGFKVLEDPPPPSKKEKEKQEGKKPKKPKGPETNYYSMTISPAIDTAILYELFNIYLQACQILSSCLLVQQVMNVMLKLPNKGQPLVGKDGMIQEYLDHQFSKLQDPGHRHFSGLYALYPGRQISLRATPSLAEAALKTLTFKAEHGGGHTNWSAAWLASLWARLGQGQKAGETLDYLLQNFVRSNLLTAHPKLDGHVPGCVTCYRLPPKPKKRPKQKKKSQEQINKLKTEDGSLFQIDGNFGAVAAIHEMLVQSHEDGLVELLPSLPPKQWPNGHITGVIVRGGHELGIFWENSKLTKVEIQLSYNLLKYQKNVRLRYKTKLKEYVDKNAQPQYLPIQIVHIEEERITELIEPPKNRKIILIPDETSPFFWFQ